jgi:hypothetical protein
MIPTVHSSRGRIVLVSLLGGCAASPPSLPSGGSGGTAVATTDGSTTTTGDADSSSSGAGDGGGSTGSGASDGSSGDTGGSSTTAPATTDATDGPADDYPPCPGGNDDECPPGHACLVGTADGAPVASACGLVCTEGEACPAPASGDAPAYCETSFRQPTCVLDCGAGSCPDGMACASTGPDSFCLWPLDQ